jgi:hypothetical protein
MIQSIDQDKKNFDSEIEVNKVALQTSKQI